MNYKQKIIALIAALGLILIAIFAQGIYKNSNSSEEPLKEETQKRDTSNDKPQLVTTNPSPLNDAVLLPNQPIEIIFNRPLVVDKTRVILEPKTDFEVQLSPDHKTMKITPTKSYQLGAGYTLTIKEGYGFDNTSDKLDHDEVFHFKTINYQGV